MPKCPAKMNLGLRREVIEDKVKDLAFQLPEEVYELYQWRNGGKNSFIPYPEAWDLTRFPPLEEAIYQSRFCKGYVIFPLFSIEDGLYFTLCTEEKSKVAPIYCGDEPENDMDREP